MCMYVCIQVCVYVFQIPRLCHSQLSCYQLTSLDTKRTVLCCCLTFTVERRYCVPHIYVYVCSRYQGYAIVNYRVVDEFGYLEDGAVLLSDIHCRATLICASHICVCVYVCMYVFQISRVCYSQLSCY